MPSSHRRSHSSRRTRSLSANDQSFIIIVTNHPDILRHRSVFRIQIDLPQEQIPSAQTNDSVDLSNREDLLANLLRIDLNDIVQEYLIRTRRSLPLHLILEASNPVNRQ